MDTLLNKTFILNYTLLENRDSCNFEYNYNLNGNIVVNIKSNSKLVRGDIVKCSKYSIEDNKITIDIEKVDFSGDLKSLYTLIIYSSRIKFPKKFNKLSIVSSKNNCYVLYSNFYKFENYKIILCLILDSNKYNNYYLKLDNFFDYQFSIQTILNEQR